MNPILLRLGPFVLHSYATLVGVGLLLGAGLVLLQLRNRPIAPVAAVDVILGAALGGLVVARAAYVGAHWTYYADHLHLAVRPWDGGLLWQGALLGGVVGAAAVCAARDLPLLSLLDLLTPGAAVLSAFAWLACFMVGCAWGIETYPGQGLLWILSLDLPDLYGIREPRVAVQLLGTAWSAIVLGVVLALRPRLQRQGTTFSLWLTLHSLGSLGLGYLRADTLFSIVGWRVDQLANLGLSVVGAATLLGLSVIRHHG